MAITLTRKGQVTIPKRIRDSLHLKPGTQLNVAVNKDGDVVLHKLKTSQKDRTARFEAVRGKADVKWRTQDLMALLRN